jgi:tetratricopeptide (TPR) repeat protein
VRSHPSDIPPGGHATDLLSDYLENRLSPESAAQVRAHLDACEACRDLFEQAQRWRDDILAQGARHIRPERLVALADAGETGTTGEEQVHLGACRMCREQLTWLAALPAPPELAATAQAREMQAGEPWSVRLRRLLFDPLARLPRWSWGAAALAAAAGVVLILLVQPPSVGPGVTGLARLEPLAVLSVRGPAGRGDFASAFRSGLERYAHGAYEQSAADFARAARLDPSHETVFLYLGSARLLAGDPAAAITALERGQANTSDPELLGEYRWQLANASLSAGRLKSARGHLDRVAASGGPHAAEARELLERIKQARGR